MRLPGAWAKGPSTVSAVVADRAAGALVAAPGGPRRVEGLGRRGALQDVGHLADLLGVDPAHHVGHGAAVERRGMEERGQHLGRRGVPELAVRRRPVGLGRLAEVGGGPAGPVPLRTPGERGPGAGPGARAAGRVDAPHPPVSRRGRPACGAAGRSSHWRPAPDRATRGWPARPGTSSCRSGSARRPRGIGPARRRCPPAERDPGPCRGAAGRPGVSPPRPAADAGRAAWPSERRGASRCGAARGAPPSRYERPATSAPPSASGSTAAVRPVIA